MNVCLSLSHRCNAAYQIVRGTLWEHPQNATPQKVRGTLPEQRVLDSFFVRTPNSEKNVLHVILKSNNQIEKTEFRKVS